MTREEQIREAAFMASMTEETIMRQEVIKDGVHVGYDNVLLRDSERPIARLFFREGVKWADANQPSPWISVEDRLPEAEEMVFVSFGDTYVKGVGYLSDDVEEYWYINGWGCIDDVTHWMPIPELPKEQ